MRRNIAMLGLAGLLALTSPANSEESKATVQVGAGIYQPLGNDFGLEGIPLGVDLGADYGNSRLGGMLSAGFYAIRNTLNERLSSRGQVLEKEEEQNIITRVRAALRIGDQLKNLSVGYAVVEGKENFEQTERRGIFGSTRETRNYPNKAIYHGPSFGGKIGDKRFFGKFELDYLSPMNSDDQKGFPSLNVGIGINF